MILKMTTMSDTDGDARWVKQMHEAVMSREPESK
jgi:hypothetical protein